MGPPFPMGRLLFACSRSFRAVQGSGVLQGHQFLMIQMARRCGLQGGVRGFEFPTSSQGAGRGARGWGAGRGARPEAAGRWATS